MTEKKQIGNLEIEEDLGFQKRTWLIERIGWIIMALIILAGLLGLLGPGPLSRATLGTREAGLRVEYNRFIRYLAPTELRVWIDPKHARDQRASLWFSHDYLKAFEMHLITPPPVLAQTGSGRFVYTFHISGSEGDSLIVIPLEPQEMGTLSGQIGLVGGPQVTMAQFSFP